MHRLVAWTAAFTFAALAVTVDAADEPVADAAGTVLPSAGLRLRAADLLADPARGLVYASVPTSEGATGNSIVAIDVDTGDVVRSVFGGSDPNALAMSDDGSVLYVTLRGANAVRQYLLPDLQFVRQFHLGSAGFSGPMFAYDVEVVPGDPDSVVVPLITLNLSPSGLGVAQVADGTVLPDRSPGHVQASHDVVFGGGQLFGTDGFDLHRLALTPTGVAEVGSAPVGTGPEIEYAGGRIYTSSGRVIDSATSSLLGTFPLPFGGGPFAVDPATGRAAYLVADPAIHILEYDVATFTLVATHDVAGSGTPVDIVRWGAGAFAYTLGDGTTHVASTSITPRAAPPAPVDQTPLTYPFKVVDQVASATAYDATRGVVYATSPATAPTRPNTIVTVDPTTAAVTSSVATGSDPNLLAISDDATALYAGLRGAGAVAQYALPGPTFVRQIPLGSGVLGQRVANDIDVMPGQPGTIVVARHRNASPPNDGAAIFDNGVQRAGTTPDHIGADRLAFLSPTSLVAQDTCCSNSEFQRISVTASGLTELSREPRLLGGHDLAVAGGRVYGTSGRIIDPATSDVIGQLPASGLLTVDPTAGRAYVIELPPGSAPRFRVIDTETFRTVATWALPPTLTNPTSITQIGPGAFAITAFDGNLHLLSPSYPAPPPPPPPTTTPPPTTVPPNQPPPTPPPAPTVDSTGEYTALAPARLLDTRDGGGLAAGTSTDIRVLGRHGVPRSGVAAVVVNVTATNTNGPGFLSVYPTGDLLPNVSSVNYGAGQTVPNLVTVPVSALGSFTVFSSARADVIVDIQGYYSTEGGTPGGRFRSVSPSRLFDTRETSSPVGAAFAPRETRRVAITGLPGGPPAGATAVVLNVTVTGPTSPGFLTVFPDGSALPLVSNLNYSAGQTVPNLVIVRVPANGVVDIHNGSDGTTDVIVDMIGYYDLDRSDDSGRFIPTEPVREVDTRDPLDLTGGRPFGQRGTLILLDPIGASGYVVNVTVTQPTANGFVTAYPFAGAVPTVSTVNFTAGATVANAAYVAVGDQGIAFMNGIGASHIIVDSFGFFT